MTTSSMKTAAIKQLQTGQLSSPTEKAIPGQTSPGKHLDRGKAEGCCSSNGRAPAQRKVQHAPACPTALAASPLQLNKQNTKLSSHTNDFSFLKENSNCGSTNHPFHHSYQSAGRKRVAEATYNGRDASQECRGA
jgi:hypothetical protein